MNLKPNSKVKITLQTLLIIGMIGFQNFGYGKVKKNVVVEHFTNTRCSICGSRNPGFYKNLQSQANKDVLHIAIHPSSPYAQCKFSMENKSENDARTNFYKIYGGTPRLVIQGKVIPTSADYGDTGIYTPYKKDSSDFKVSAFQTKYKKDSILSYIVIKKVSASTLTKGNLFASLVSDTIKYSAPNGENTHYDVLRKVLFSASGKEITFPVKVGDSVVIKAISLVPSNGIWDVSHLYTLAMMQDVTSKEMIQVGRGDTKSTSFVTGLASISVPKLEVNIYPNPSTGLVNIYLDGNKPSTLRVLDVMGKVYLKETITGNKSINIEAYPKGLYFFEISNQEGASTKQLIKQ